MTKIKKYPRLPRTREATIFEIIMATLLLVLWIVVIRVYMNSEDIIPTHFDINGNPNGYGSRDELFVPGVLGTLTTLLFSIGAYFPSYVVNVPVRIETPRQILLMSRMTRVLGVEFLLLFICIALMMGNCHWLGNFILGFVAIMLLTAVGFCLYAVKVK